MSARSAMSTAGLPRRNARYLALLAGASTLVLATAGSLPAWARSLNGGGAGVASAPNLAADAATQAAQQAATAARQTQDSLARAARAVQDMQAIQAAARAAAAAAQTSTTAPLAVSNGLGAGGLLPGGGSWNGANAPTQSVDASGQTQVNIRQQTQQAILNWQSFNIGARTTLSFDQQGNSSWVALNRVNNATAPSQILGQIKADGHVYVINPSGIIFGGSSQINVGSLIVSTAGITDEQFKASGIYATKDANGYVPNFTAAGGKVIVEAGASINTLAPGSVTSGGGFVLMIGSQVENAGAISTPKGQALLAAGDAFILRPGFSSTDNQGSTTRGIEVSPVISAQSDNGRVVNSGIILAQQGDITLAGRDLMQAGTLIATTSVNTRGTIHLLNKASDTAGSITLADGSLTTVLPELGSTETALDSQRDALITASTAANAARSATGDFDNLSVLADRQDQSRIEIVTGGTVTFKSGSTTAAQGGQIAVSARKRIFVEDGALLDASGLRNVALAMESNNLKVNVQGNELRDSPQNRDSDVLKSNDVWIDIRSLTLVQKDTGGYASNRYYTKGGLLEVGGYLGTAAHTIGEWSAIGGTITLAAPEVIAQHGAVFDISGGSLDYAAGWIRSTNLIGSDGRRYTVDTAPADMTFVSFAGGFSRTHNVQGKQDERLTEVWTSLFDRGRTSLRWEDGYSVGRDAGRLILSTPTSVFEADIVADTITGSRQTTKRTGNTTDGYTLTQTTIAQNGTLAIGDYGASGRAALHGSDVRIGEIADIASGIDAATALPADRLNTVWFDAPHLSAQRLGGLDLATNGKITINAPLQLADGGSVSLIAPVIDIKADISARSGSVSATNLFTPSGTSAAQVPLMLNGQSTITLRDGATIDVRGLWTNAVADSDDRTGLAYRDGGGVSLQSSRNVVIEQSATIDTSSGASLERGSFKGGKGGNVSLIADALGTGTGRLTLNGALRAYGAAGGGKLTVETGASIVIGGTADQAALNLKTSLFRSGFAQYDVIGHKGLSVAAGTLIDVTMPSLTLAANASSVVTGRDPSNALTVWTAPLYLPNAPRTQLTQRGGASLLLQAGTKLSAATDMANVGLDIARDAVITVDPGQSITLQSIGQLTVDGTLNAWSGNITLASVDIGTVAASELNAAGHNRSIWLGDHAVLDVAARAATALDLKGQTYGLIAAGGNITIGGTIDQDKAKATAPDLFVVISQGARLDASGTQASLDLLGQGTTSVASNGGSIALTSRNGLYLNGSLKADAGGAGAAGGSLSVALETQDYPIANAVDRVLKLRELVLSQTADRNVTRDDLLAYGHGQLDVGQIKAGGFDNLTVLSNGVIAFDGDVGVSLKQSLSLYSGGLVLTDTARSDALVALSSAYVRLAGVALVGKDFYLTPTLRGGVSQQATQAKLSIDSSILDARDLVSFGARGVIKQSGNVDPTIDRRGFAEVDLEAAGDLRLLQSVVQTGTTVTTPGLLRLTAAQIYPATNAQATIEANHLITARATNDDPAVPYSAFGRLKVSADIIDHGGVLRVPLGDLTLGATNGFVGNGGTSRINLLAGSILSVSGAGLVMPYGGTVDGQVYSYAGTPLSANLLGSDRTTANPGALHFAGQSVVAEAGSLIDLRGGGELTGGAFISGRGGSVNILAAPLVAANPAYAYSNAKNTVYAIVPSSAADYAPVAAEGGSNTPLIGQQITLDGSVPGLPAGTYTLLPSTYALLPGAFRVEIASKADPRSIVGSAALGNGSFLASGRLGIAHTDIRDSLAHQVIVTAAAQVRQHSQFNDMSFSQFAVADAARLGVPRIRLPSDARNLSFEFSVNRANDQSLAFAGAVLGTPAAGGWGSSISLAPASGGSLEIVAAGGQPTAGFTGVTLYDREINALNASQLLLGGTTQVLYGQGGNFINFNSFTKDLIVHSGASLTAQEVFLVSGRTDGGITVERGAAINTLGRGWTGQDSRDGFIYAPGIHSVLAVSNGYLTVLAPVAAASGQLFGPGAINIGGCVNTCDGTTRLYSEGTIVAATNNSFSLDDAVRYGTRNLSLAVGSINVGNAQSLADAAALDVLPSGLTLNQSVLNRLISGDTSAGAPALESLILTAAASVNFYGDVMLDTYDPVTGRSTLNRLVLTTPAIYGYGGTGTVAGIRTANLVWTGSQSPAGAVVAQGAGTGSSTLNLQTERMEFGFGPFTQPSNTVSYDRLALGFAHVSISASDRVTANHRGTLKVYQTQGAYVAGTGYDYSGGDLTIATPLLTGDAGSINSITAGGAVRITGAGASETTSRALGGELAISGDSIVLGTAVALSSGKLTLSAAGDITLTDAAFIDVSGRPVAFNDVTKYSGGGSVTLESRNGSVRQSAGSRIDLSAQHNNAGVLTVTALDAASGIVDLQGDIRGATSGSYDAGGTYVPYRGGSVTIRAQRLGDTSAALSDQFAALNARLNAGEVFGARSFQLKQGDLTIGDGLRAGTIDVALDGGRLTVIGTVDASGAQVGSIRLAAMGGLILAGTALLDAHGTQLRVDSYGKIIDSENRAIVELSSGNGVLMLASGARIDLRHGTDAAFGSGPGQNDGIARGSLELNAPRIGSNGLITDADAATFGDIAIDASGAISVQGARSIAVNAMQRYTDAPDGTDAAASQRPYQVITQAWLDGKHAEAEQFINAIVLRSSVVDGKLGGLNNSIYRNAFHLRPGIEIASKTADGDLVVQGDLDLSGYRYKSLNPNSPLTGVYGSGEVGMLTLRAGGDLSIYGSITDGFAPPPVTPDDQGWVLVPGNEPFGGDVIVPGTGVVLADGTEFSGGKTLNYDLPIKATTYGAGVVLPVQAKLAQSLTLPAGTVLSAAVRDTNGQVYPAGTMLKTSLTLLPGSSLDAGTRLTARTNLADIVWPKGVALPATIGTNGGNAMDRFVLNGDLALLQGALIPSETTVLLPGGALSANLRPVVGANQGRNWAIAPMLAAGSQSWSLRLVGGADLVAADTWAVKPGSAHGSVILADTHYSVFMDRQRTVIPGQPEQGGWILGDFEDDPDWSWIHDEMGYNNGDTIDEETATWMCNGAPANICRFDAIPGTGTPDQVVIGDINAVRALAPIFSVVRTGTGDLDMIAARDVTMRSLYGVYTAGTQSANVDAAYNRVRALASDNTVLGSFKNSFYDNNIVYREGNEPGKISYAQQIAGYEKLVDAQSVYQAWYPTGGGNVLLSAGGNVTGDISAPDSNVNGSRTGSTAAVSNWLWRQGSSLTGTSTIPAAWWINFGTYKMADVPQVVGFTGIGALGGGTVDLRIGGDAGAISRRGDPLLLIRGRSEGLVVAVGSSGRADGLGALTITGGGDLSMLVSGGLNPSLAARMGNANGRQIHDLNGVVVDLRGAVRLDAGAIGGIDLTYGSLKTQQDAREVRAYDPFSATIANASGGIVVVPGDSAVSLTTRRDLVLGGAGGADASSFSLWTDHTAIDLLSVGGNLTPSTQLSETKHAYDNAPAGYGNSPAIAGRYIYPSILRAAAASGSIYYGPSGVYEHDKPLVSYSLALAPSSMSQLEILAAGSIYAGGYVISQSQGAITTSSSGSTWPARFYALTGDLVGVSSGEIITYGPNSSSLTTRYESAGTVWMLAGRDIVNSGSQLGAPGTIPNEISSQNGKSVGNLFVHHADDDVSIVSAGRDILYSSFNVAGPGTLEISAGRNLLMEGKASVNSIGSIVAGDNRPGASIAMIAGAGASGADYARLAALYLDPANRAVTGVPLADQAGKVAKTYESELITWLKTQNGFSGSVEEARAAFAALPAEQQRIFLRQVYFAELRAGGREYNDASSSRFGSYLRGRQMIATLFPDTDANGNPIARSGDITMFGDAGVHTDFGGDIQMLAPSGKVVIGVEGETPAASAGIVTQGQGDIQIYSQGSVLLGLSRIMTTFGGNILAWSATGDINAGRGTKTSVFYTPPKRVYDIYGNVTLSPQAPASGAGIATLNPIPEVPAGDIDLIAPLGTIDAGEAGIRVSGSVNLAALQVLNAANIQVQGTSTGIPTVQAPNIAAALSTSNATAASQQTATPNQGSGNAQPSVIIVEVLGYGGGGQGNPDDEDERRDRSKRSDRGYDSSNQIRVLGNGQFSSEDTQQLTALERETLSAKVTPLNRP